jgi:hypothetical protein
VAFVVSAPVRAASENAVTLLWDKKSRRFSEVPWEPGLRADNRTLAVNFLSADARGLWLGTSLGLLRYDRDGGASGTWRRFLPDAVVDAGFAAPEGKTVWVTAHPRRDAVVRLQEGVPFGRGGMRTTGSGITNTRPAAWRLARVTLTNRGGHGEVQEWTPPENGDPSVSASEGAGGGPRRFDGFNPPVENLRDSPPLGVTVAADGTVWTSHWSHIVVPFGGGGVWGGSRERLGGFARFDPKAETWEPHPLRQGRRPGPGYAPPFPGGALEITARSSEEGRPGVLPFESVPEGAVLPLALAGLRPTGVYGDTEVFWMRRRFPEWLCPDEPAAEAMADVPAPGVLAPRRGGAPVPGISVPAPDPAQPGMVWLADYANGALIRLPATDIPASLLASRRVGIYSSGDPKLDGPKVERFLPPEEVTISARPNVQHLIPAAGSGGGPGQDRLWVVMQGSIAGWDDRTGKWVPFRVPGRDTMFNRYDSPMLPDGKDGAVLFLSSWSDAQLLRYDPAAETYTVLPLATPPTRNLRLLARAEDGGIWLRGGNTGRELFYLPAEARKRDASSASRGELVRVPDDPNASAGGAPAAVAATGKIGWTLRQGQPSTLVGYDVEKRAWTAAQTLSQRYSSQPLSMLPDGVGGAYVAGDQDNAAVYHYDRATDRWTVAAPPLPALRPKSDIYPNSVLAGADAEALYVVGLGRYLFRYDRKRQRWDDNPTPLPAALGTHGSSENDIIAARAGASVYVGGAGGLFRLPAGPRSVSGAEWERLDYRLPVRFGGGTSNRGSWDEQVRWREIAVTRTTVYAVAASNARSFGARLDRATGRWTVFDETRGFPERGFNYRLVADEHGAWLVHTSGMYRLERGGDRWQLAFRGLPINSDAGDTMPPAASLPPGGADTAPTGGVGAIATDETAGESFLLVNAPVGPPNTYGTVPILWRWDLRTGKGAALANASAAPPERGFAWMGNGTSLLLDSGFVWIGTDRGGLFRASRSGGPWQPAALPPGVPTTLDPAGLVRDPVSGSLWIVGRENVLRWSKPG